VNLGFDSAGVECRQRVGVLEDLFMADDLGARFFLQPARDLSVGDDDDPPEPRRILLDRAQRIAKVVEIAEALRAGAVRGRRFAGAAGFFRPVFSHLRRE
jgi:hypothetical protein